MDVIAKVVIAIVAGWWVWHTYPESKKKDFRKAYWDRQMSLFFDATQTAARIATLPNDDPKRMEAISKFWELYRGQMIVIETKRERDPVAQAMIHFGRCLREPASEQPKDKCDICELRNRAWHLAKACRDSIGASWNQSSSIWPSHYPTRENQSDKLANPAPDVYISRNYCGALAAIGRSGRNAQERLSGSVTGLVPGTRHAQIRHAPGREPQPSMIRADIPLNQ